VGLFAPLLDRLRTPFAHRPAAPGVTPYRLASGGPISAAQMFPGETGDLSVHGAPGVKLRCSAMPPVLPSDNGAISGPMTRK
jgi:hypothetical protein